MLTKHENKWQLISSLLLFRFWFSPKISGNDIVFVPCCVHINFSTAPIQSYHQIQIHKYKSYERLLVELKRRREKEINNSDNNAIRSICVELCFAETVAICCMWKKHWISFRRNKTTGKLSAVLLLQNVGAKHKVPISFCVSRWENKVHSFLYIP